VFSYHTIQELWVSHWLFPTVKICDTNWFDNISLPNTFKCELCLVCNSLLLTISLIVTWLKIFASLLSLPLKSLIELFRREQSRVSYLKGAPISITLMCYAALFSNRRCPAICASPTTPPFPPSSFPLLLRTPSRRAGGLDTGLLVHGSGADRTFGLGKVF
jgi:hypothetical protein